MAPVQVRKYVTVVEEILHEGGPPPAVPRKRAAVAAVVENPFAGRYVEEIVSLMDDLKPLGMEMARRLVVALGDAKAIVPSAKKVGGLGTRLDVPITHINASYVRSHFDAFEIGIADAPRSHEIVFVLGLSIGPRVHNRAGGLAAKDVKGEDGLR